MSDRLQQGEQELVRLRQLAERLQSELPRSQYETFEQTIRNRQEHLQSLQKVCQQAREEHEQMVKTQHKFNEELMAMNDWFKRLILELSQPIDLNLSLANLEEAQAAVNVSLHS